jgi:hypothetical protein
MAQCHKMLFRGETGGFCLNNEPGREWLNCKDRKVPGLWVIWIVDLSRLRFQLESGNTAGGEEGARVREVDGTKPDVACDTIALLLILHVQRYLE